jgi:hypothetical protein
MTTRPRSTSFAMGALLTVALTTGACASSSDVIAFPLVYQPTNKADTSKAAGLAPIPEGTLLFLPQVVDRRQIQDPNILGISQEADPDANVYNAAGGQVPTEFLRNVMAKELSAMGFQVTADPVAATHTVQLQLDQFWLVEGSTFQGTVMGQVWLIDRSGTTRWQGPITGKSSRWGRSLSPENYLQAISDATLEAAVKLATTAEFRAALAAQ